MPKIIPEDSAKLAGLKYVTDDELTFRRVKRGKSFIYLNETGKSISDEKLLARFKMLVIPPAWDDVRICKYLNGHIQATGRDAKGRKQYIYHPKWEIIRNENKYDKMIEFAEFLPAIRKQVDSDLRKKTLCKEKVTAIIVTLLEETLIRVGNEEYAKKNKSFGLTTLQNKHFEVTGNQLRFEFKGKSGKDLIVAMYDKRLAKLVKQLQEIYGQQLFQYYDDEGKRQPAASQDVNDYLKEITKEDFTAKDFRTWGGTVTAAEILFNFKPAENEKETKSKITSAIKKVARVLNNTPAICRKYYIHPEIFEAYSDGSLQKEMALSKNKKNEDKFGLTPEESAVLKILIKAAEKRKKLKKAV
jgi:DNA topoisomerase I